MNISTINKEGERLAGIVEGQGNRAVLLVHGFGVTKDEYGDFKLLSKSLTDLGYCVYRFDFSGCGESEGNYEQTSLSKQVADLKNIIDFVKTEKNNGALAVIGKSLGGCITGILNPDVNCIVLMSTPAHPKESLSEYFKEHYNPNSVSILPRSDGSTTRIGAQFWKDLNQYDIPASIGNITKPVLFIHGSEDNIINPKEMEELYVQAHDSKKKILIQGAKHGYQKHQKELVKAVNGWLEKYLLTNKH